MKRYKKVKATIIIEEIKSYQVTCPHCGNKILFDFDAFDENTLRMKCRQCGDPLELIFNEYMEVK